MNTISIDNMGADPTTGDVESVNFKSVGQGFGITSMKLDKNESMESKINKTFSVRIALLRSYIRL